MLALRVTTAPKVAITESPDPEPADSEALVHVRAFSLNRGEVLDLSRAGPDDALGWDLAGVVERPAADGTGPGPGTRVVGLVRRGAWAELAAVPTSQLAVLPDAVSDSAAAALPTAGLTALRSLELGGVTLAKHVLVTGANGGVGRFAVQLAALAGAEVTALVRDVAGGDASLRRLGATEVLDRVDRDYDLIVDAVGGETFGAAIEHVAPGGLVVNLATGGPDEVVTFRATRFDRAHGARIVTLDLLDELPALDAARALARLVRLVELGRLSAPVELEAPWQETERAIEALLKRTIGGKAVLLVRHGP